jgi:hypothetical protein
MATVTSSCNFFTSDFNARIEKCRKLFLYSRVLLYIGLYSSIIEEGIEPFVNAVRRRKLSEPVIVDLLRSPGINSQLGRIDSS